MSKFTQGDWRCDYDDNKYIFGANDEVIGELYFITDEETKANARLITEAKNMYEQLKSTLYAIHEILPYIPDGINDIKVPVNKRDLLITEATLIDDILTRIDGEQEA